MTRQALANLGGLVRKHRDNKTLRQAAEEIGVGHATLIRVESGRVPDVETFGKICRWLGKDPGDFLGFPAATEGAAPSELIEIAAHLRAERDPQPATVNALARMILAATQRQRQTTDPDVET